MLDGQRVWVGTSDTTRTERADDGGGEGGGLPSAVRGGECGGGVEAGVRWHELGQPYVCELGGAVGAEQHIGRLDVTVDHRLRAHRNRPVRVRANRVRVGVGVGVGVGYSPRGGACAGTAEREPRAWPPAGAGTT